MQPKNKKIILIAVTAAAAIGVFLFAPFGTQQIGNTVINGNYYDTPLEAYNHADASFDVKEEIATVDITEKSAIWLVYTDDSNEDTIVVEGMSVEDNKYYDLGDTALLNCQNRKNPQSKIELDNYIEFSDAKVNYEVVMKDNYDKLENKPDCLSKELSYTDQNGNKTEFVFLYQISEDD